MRSAHMFVRELRTYLQLLWRYFTLNCTRYRPYFKNILSQYCIRLSMNPYSYICLRVFILCGCRQPLNLKLTELITWFVFYMVRLSTYNTYNKHPLPLFGFEPTISVDKRPQTYVLDHPLTMDSLILNWTQPDLRLFVVSR